MTLVKRLIQFRVSTLFMGVLVAALVVVIVMQRQQLQQARSVGYGDVMAISIPGVLPAPGGILPKIDVVDADGTRSVAGFPITVLDDGTISLPTIGVVPVVGLTIDEVRQEITKRYAASAAATPTGEVSADFIVKQVATFVPAK